MESEDLERGIKDERIKKEGKAGNSRAQMVRNLVGDLVNRVIRIIPNENISSEK